MIFQAQMSSSLEDFFIFAMTLFCVSAMGPKWGAGVEECGYAQDLGHQGIRGHIYMRPQIPHVRYSCAPSPVGMERWGILRE